MRANRGLPKPPFSQRHWVGLKFSYVMPAQAGIHDSDVTFGFNEVIAGSAPSFISYIVL